MSTQYGIRTDSAEIGVSDEDPFIWAIKSASWNDRSPWVHLDKAGGDMEHQHLLSPQIEGQIECQDLDAMNTALFATEIDTATSPHYAVYTDGTKYRCDYFCINMVTHTGATIKWVFTNFRVETINVGSIAEGKEAVVIVKFSADAVDSSGGA